MLTSRNLDKKPMIDERPFDAPRSEDHEGNQQSKVL